MQIVGRLSFRGAWAVYDRAAYDSSTKSVGVGTRFRAGRPGVRVPVPARYLPVLRGHSDLVAHPAGHSRVKAAGT